MPFVVFCLAFNDAKVAAAKRALLVCGFFLLLLMSTFPWRDGGEGWEEVAAAATAKLSAVVEWAKTNKGS